MYDTSDIHPCFIRPRMIRDGVHTSSKRKRGKIPLKDRARESEMDRSAMINRCILQMARNKKEED